MVTGDGDGLSIGGNHLIHALRRNVNLKILLFNNQIYGLTKGQYSPTSEEGKVTKSTPFGSVDHPFNPIALALGAEATFVARTLDNDRQHLTEVLRQAAAHQGTAFVEIYQNCNVFNDGAFDLLREKPQGAHNQIRLVHGEPIVFDEGTRCVAVGENGRLVIANTADDAAPSAIVVHDVHGRPSLAFALAHLSHGPTEPTCIGVFREFERPVYGRGDERAARQGRASALGKGDLETLLHRRRHVDRRRRLRPYRLRGPPDHARRSERGPETTAAKPAALRPPRTDRRADRAAESTRRRGRPHPRSRGDLRRVRTVPRGRRAPATCRNPDGA